MHEVGIKPSFLFKSRVLVLSFDMACSDIHSTKYSGGHKTLMKIIKNAGGGWQLFFFF